METINENTLLSELRYKDIKELIMNANAEAMTSVNSAIKSLETKMDKIIDENNELKNEIKALRVEREVEHRRLINLETSMKKKNLIFKDIPSEVSASDAVVKLCGTKLNVNVDLKGARKIYDRNGKMGVIAEFGSELVVESVLKKTRALTGTPISIERDLNSDRQNDKKVMIQLKKDILEADKRHAVRVRDDALRINNKWIRWDKEKVLSSGAEKGVNVFKELYGNVFDNYDFSYKVISDKIRNRDLF